MGRFPNTNVRSDNTTIVIKTRNRLRLNLLIKIGSFLFFQRHVLKIRAVVASDQGNFIVIIQFFNFRDERIRQCRFLQANAVC